jgi:hypothetical protein
MKRRGEKAFTHLSVLCHDLSPHTLFRGSTAEKTTKVLSRDAAKNDQLCEDLYSRAKGITQLNNKGLRIKVETFCTHGQRLCGSFM